MNRVTPGPDNRPAVLHVVHALARGGAEVLVRDLVARRRDEARFVVLSLSGEGPLAAELEAKGATVHRFDRKPGFDVDCAREIARVAKQHNVDAIHAHQYSPFVYAALSRLFGAWRCRVIYTEHGRPYPDAPRLKRILANRLALLPLTHRVTAVSDFIGRALTRCEAIPARRIERIYNGIDPTPLEDSPDRPDPVQTRRALGIADTQTMILQVAGFRPVKDHATAVRAFAALFHDRPNARLVFAGDGPTRAATERLANELGIGRVVLFLGERTDVPDLWRAADVGLLSSLSEGTSVAALEAMAAAKPFVATGVGGNGEVVVDWLTGRLTPRGDAPAMAEALRSLIDRPAMARAMGQAGRRRLHARFTQTQMHDRFAELYRNCRRSRSGNTGRAGNKAAIASPQPADDRDHLIVFADDFGRHPSSMQHLAGHLAKTCRITWINTIGMRRPTLCLADAQRALTKVGHWITERFGSESNRHADGEPADEAGSTGAREPTGIEVLNPVMWPSFAGPWQRVINRRLLGRAIERIAATTAPGRSTTVVTTLPVTADLHEARGVDRWVYYRVDDFAHWPGLDGRTLAAMDERQLRWVDRIIAASAVLAEQAGAAGREATLLTHGLDLEAWRAPAASHPVVDQIRSLPGRKAVYWGLIDERLNREAIGELARGDDISVVLVGPTQGETAELRGMANVTLTGRVDRASLPAIAEAADVLIMPYRTTPATLAMQPLKLTEYLATDRPVVCLELPALRAWADACDVVGRGAFADRVRQRAIGGLEASQRHARRRLAGEDWSVKAAQMDRLIRGEPTANDRAAA